MSLSTNSLLLWLTINSCVTWWICSCSVLTDIPPQFCQRETFNASCPPGHVILMTSAYYGRMRVGRCVHTDTHVGCNSNVLETYADLRCSGRQWCAIEVADKKLFELQTCPRDLHSYLEATYECLDLSGWSNECSSGQMLVDKQQGYLSSAKQLGTRRCPWRIVVQPGQVIKVTVYNFAVSLMSSTHASRSMLTDSNHNDVLNERRTTGCTYLLFREAQVGDKIVCVTGNRMREVYKSTTNDVFIYIDNLETHMRPPDQAHFLIKFEAMGCADLPTMDNTVIERVDKDNTVVSCVNSRERSHLVCRDKVWIGEIRNCSSDQALGIKGSSGGKKEDVPLGLLIAITVGVIIGIVLGFVSLIVAFYCKNGRRRTLKPRETVVVTTMGTAPSSGLLQDPWIDDERTNAYKLFDLRPNSPQHSVTPCHHCCPDVTTVGGDYGVSLLQQCGRGDDALYATNADMTYADRRSLMQVKKKRMGSLCNGIDGDNNEQRSTNTGIGGECQGLCDRATASVDKLNDALVSPQIAENASRALHHSSSNATVTSHYGTATYGPRAQAYATPSRTLSRESTGRVTWRELPSVEH